MGAESVYGNSPVFLNAMDACVGTIYLVGISSETRCWLERPVTQEETYRYRGEVYTRRILAPGSEPPMSVAEWAHGLPPHRWYRPHGVGGEPRSHGLRVCQARWREHAQPTRLLWQRNMETPYLSQKGKANRKESPWRCGHERMEEAKAIL